MANRKVKTFFTVGIGSSAGGLDALKQILKNLSSDHDFCIIIAQHVSPDHKSRLVDILDSVTSWPVVKAENDLVLEVRKVYITPPDNEITVSEGKIRLEKYEPNVHAVPSIDNFLKSLATDLNKYAIGVILSGTGQDGAEGVQAIRKHKGFVIAQSREEAAYPSMPDHARRTGVVNRTCLAHEIPQEIQNYINNFEVVQSQVDQKKSSRDAIIELMMSRTGTDFSKYKPSTITRRINKRLEELGLKNYDDYYALIQKTPTELDKLFRTVLIGVTEFFRDKKAFDDLKVKIKDYLKKKQDKSIRIWSIGCATGEEPYTIAIILLELLGEQLKKYTIQIFATDIDSHALTIGRKGYYKRELVNNLPAAYLEKYFKETNGGYEIKNFIRQLILFSKHDITVDPPFVRMDFISCRNLLIYFTTELQREVLPIFHYSLNSGGYLLLGKSENVAQVTNLFYKADTNAKLFQRKDDVELNTLNFNTYVKKYAQSRQSEATVRSELSVETMAKETLIKTYENPYVVLDDQMETIYIKGSLQPYVDLGEGALNSNILKIIHRSLHIELRTLFAKAKRNQASAQSNVIRYEAFDNDHYVQMQIKPLLYKKNNKEFFLLIFKRINPEERFLLNEELLKKKEYQETFRIIELEQELEASREHLQTFTEELETSNEELQALNEELQSSNEELKSSNEELETSNEELQSTNEELQTANAELHIANENFLKKENELIQTQKELVTINQRFELILDNSKIFMACQDTNLRYIWVYNELKEFDKNALYGFTDDQVFAETPSASSFIAIKKKVLKTQQEISEEITFNERHWNFMVKPWRQNNKLFGIWVLAIDITEQKKSVQKIELRNRTINSLMENSEDYLLVINKEGQIQIINEKLRKDIISQSDISLNVDDSFRKLNKNNYLKKNISEYIDKALSGKKSKVDQFEGIGNNDTSHPYYYYLNVAPITDNLDNIIGAVYMGTEITSLLQSKTHVQEALKRGAHLIEEEYFKDLTLQLHELFGCKYNYVGVLTPDQKSIKTKAIRINGKLSKNFTYALKNVPCEVVNRKDEIQHFNHVHERFPGDPKLIRWDAESYVGVPVSSPITGEILGIMVMIGKRKIDLNKDSEYLLTILSLRAGAELLRQQNTKQLKQRDEQLDKITRNSPDVIYEFHQSAKGTRKFNYVSKACNEVLEIAPSKLLKDASLIDHLKHPEETKDFFKLQQKNFKDPQPIKWTGRILGYRTRDTKWIRLASNPEVLKNGDVIWNGIIDDVSSQKAIEEQLKEAKEAAEEAAFAKENFLATMSHEIRSPLNAIYGITELLQMEEKTKNIEHLDILKFSTQHLMSLINNLLDFSKLKAGKFSMSSQPVHLHNLLKNLHKSISFLAKSKNLKVELKIGDKVPQQIMGDELVLSQIFHNLLSNANKFTDAGKIILLAELVEEKKDSFLILFSVQDTGRGIESTNISKIFEKFEQSNYDRTTTGTGLGLTITKMLLNLLGSEIEVESTKGKGSRFHFVLDLKKFQGTKPKGGSQKSDKRNKINPSQNSLLVVEDKEDNRKLLVNFLTKHDYDIDECVNGKEAVEAIQSKKYNLVLMDLRMPGMDGVEATKQIRKMKGDYYQKLPILALTADMYGIQKDTGFTDIIIKPFKFKDLVNTIEKYIQH